MTNTINSYKDLIVWQRAIELTIEIYRVTTNFPQKEDRGLTSQMRRAAVSIASNIAEGRYRGTRKDFMNFLRISFASGAELETQIYIAKQLDETKNLDYAKVENLLMQTMKMLNTLLQSLKAKS